MNNKLNKFIFLSIVALLSVFNNSLAQIEVVACFTSDHRLIKPGESWDEDYNGVKYRCTCNGDGTTSCVPLSSNSPNFNTGSSNTNQQIVDNILQPLFQNLLNWIFSPSENNSNSDGYSQADRDAENEQYKKAFEEYQKKVREQVSKANNEYADLIKKKFENDKQHTVNDFKDRIAKSDAVKNIKVLNCAAYNSIEISKAVLDNQLDFRDLSSNLENNRVLADFENSKASNCPEVKINIPEVTALNPVSFQERFFETVKMKSDSITVKIGLMKEKEKRIKELVVQREKVIEQLKKTEKPIDENKKDDKKVSSNDDKLLQDALDALNEAVEEQKKVEDELMKNEKDIEQLEKVRSVYDINSK